MRVGVFVCLFVCVRACSRAQAGVLQFGSMDAILCVIACIAEGQIVCMQRASLKFRIHDLQGKLLVQQAGGFCIRSLMCTGNYGSTFGSTALVQQYDILHYISV